MFFLSDIDLTGFGPSYGVAWSDLDDVEVIPRRHAAMLDFLARPRTVDDLVAHRFMYRAHVPADFADRAERRCAELHLSRMLARGEAETTGGGRRYVAV